MTKKSFVTVYDADCKEYAETLMTLVSKDELICNIEREVEEFKKDRSVVSGEYVLTIGKKGSVHHIQNFKDVYSNYGIHIGYFGTKAWISCERYNWDIVSQFNFKKELYSICEKVGMNTDDIDETVKVYVNPAELDSMLSGKVQINSELSAEIKDILATTHVEPLFVRFHNVIDAFEMINILREKRKQQYRFATALFFDKYLNDFLQIKKEEKENQQF